MLFFVCCSVFPLFLLFEYHAHHDQCCFAAARAMITQCVEAECEILGTCPVYFCAYMFDTAAPFSTIFFFGTSMVEPRWSAYLYLATFVRWFKSGIVACNWLRHSILILFIFD